MKWITVLPYLASGLIVLLGGFAINVYATGVARTAVLKERNSWLLAKATDDNKALTSTLEIKRRQNEIHNAPRDAGAFVKRLHDHSF